MLIDGAADFAPLFRGDAIPCRFSRCRMLADAASATLMPLFSPRHAIITPAAAAAISPLTPCRH
jgi:hypothetical protein